MLLKIHKQMHIYIYIFYMYIYMQIYAWMVLSGGCAGVCDMLGHECMCFSHLPATHVSQVSISVDVPFAVVQRACLPMNYEYVLRIRPSTSGFKLKFMNIDFQLF